VIEISVFNGQINLVQLFQFGLHGFGGHHRVAESPKIRGGAAEEEYHQKRGGRAYDWD
jgi:hypothetical protein